MKFKSLIIFLLLSCFSLYSQENKPYYMVDSNGVIQELDTSKVDSDTSEYIRTYLYIAPGVKDTSNVELRNDTALYSNLMKDRAFNYREPAKSSSIWDKIIYEIEKFLNSLFAPVFNSAYGKYIFIGALLIILFFIVKKAFGKDFSAFFIRNKKIKLGTVNLEQNIEEIDFNNLIDIDINEQRYKDAIRHMYLNVLKILAMNRTIDWKIEKTNFDYYIEIKDATLKNKFQAVSLIFNYIEYGDFEIDKARFDIARKKFDWFNKSWSAQ